MPSLARWCYHRRWIVLAFWVVVLIAANVVVLQVGSNYKNDFNLPNTESKRALDVLKADFPQRAGVTVDIVVQALGPDKLASGRSIPALTDPSVRANVESMLAAVSTQPHVVQPIQGFYGSQGARQISKDGRIAFATVQLDLTGNNVPKADIKKLINTAQSFAVPHFLQVELSGSIIQQATQKPPGASEAIGIVAAAIVLFIAFGSLFAMFLPLLTAMLALGTGISLIGLMTHALSVAEFGPTLATLIGLGVGVDYALFIVSRHRTNLRAGHTPEESVIIAINTSGRAVIFAGITVCIALLGLFLLRVSFLYGVALSASLMVLLTMVTAITFLPAMLGFLGMKVLSRRERRALAADGPKTSEDLSPSWYRWARTIEKRPLVFGSLSLVVMLVLGVPFLSLRLGSSDEGSDPGSTTSRRAYDLLGHGFGPGFSGPLQLVAKINSPSDVREFGDLVATVKTQPGVASVTSPVVSPTGTAAIANVYPTTSPQAAATSTLIKHLRKGVVHQAEVRTGLVTYVGGATAIFDDFSSVLANKLPLFVGVVVLLAFLLLMVVFRSIVVPLTASVMNLLAAGAAFGLVVAVFQWGWGDALVGVDKTGPIEAFLPVLLFAILFGLSMDYEVFLVSRMHEEWLRTGDNNEAIALGQAETGRVITAAALIMIMVFGSFVFGGERVIKLFGIGLSGAVLLDALIIRTVLVPAVMHSLGKANWWLPGWLDRKLPHLGNGELPIP